MQNKACQDSPKNYRRKEENIKANIEQLVQLKDSFLILQSLANLLTFSARRLILYEWLDFLLSSKTHCQSKQHKRNYKTANVTSYHSKMLILKRKERSHINYLKG